MGELAMTQVIQVILVRGPQDRGSIGLGEPRRGDPRDLPGP